MPLYKVELEGGEWFVEAMNRRCALKVVAEYEKEKILKRTKNEWALNIFGCDEKWSQERVTEEHIQNHIKGWMEAIKADASCKTFKIIHESVKVCDMCGVRRPISEGSHGALCGKCQKKRRDEKTYNIPKGGIDVYRKIGRIRELKR